MKKMMISFILTALLLTPYAFSDEQPVKQFESSGEVTSSDPVYSRVTIKHRPIAGFVSREETEFFVSSPDLLKGINRYDTVAFAFEDRKGDVRITRITKTGVAVPKEESLAVGQAVQDVLTTTGEAAKAVTSPIPPVHQVVSSTMGATTDTTQPVLDKAKPEIKEKF